MAESGSRSFGSFFYGVKMNTKVCTNPKCRKELPATSEFFYKSKRGKFGLKSECKECSNKRERKRSKSINTDASIKRTCIGCGEEFPATLKCFYRDKRGKFGLKGECKECVNKRDKEKNNPVNTDISIKQTCSGECGKEKPATLEYFYRLKSGKFGVAGECKECKIKNSVKYTVEYRKTPKGRAGRKNADAKRRAQKRTQTQFFWTPNKNLINQIYLVCPKDYEVDHMVPLSKGGDHHESNLCYLPKSVNSSKKDRSIEEFGVDIFNKNVIYWQDMLILLL